MTSQKDIKKNNSIIKTGDLSVAAFYGTSVERYASFAQRSQKILTAVYMITEFLDAHDPLRTLLRNHTTDTMHVLFQIISHDRKDLLESFSRSLNMLFANISYLDTLYANACVSQMNYTIIRQEMYSLQVDISSEMKHLSEKSQFLQPAVSHGFVLDRNLFKRQNPPRTFSPQTESSEHIKDTLSVEPPVKKTSSVESPVFVSKNSFTQRLPKKTPQLVSQHKQQRVSHKHDPKQQRRDQILTILKNKRDASINDIADLIQDCSSKTIQRDLTQLIKEGRVIKEGSRRWSVYNLAQ